MDEDNLTAACKWLIDPLKVPKGRQQRRRAGVIIEDDPGMMELVVKQVRWSLDAEKELYRDSFGGTEIIIEDLEEGKV